MKTIYIPIGISGDAIGIKSMIGDPGSACVKPIEGDLHP